ncbi:hypothetical protein VNO77_23207 [Canavalia gladiata]|uniref:Uncharacterized protein n=1 Tax=Canavalia gladiata TaxID=3824 RepID=A0AAN9L6J9_CANGL
MPTYRMQPRRFWPYFANAIKVTLCMCSQHVEPCSIKSDIPREEEEPKRNRGENPFPPLLLASSKHFRREKVPSPEFTKTSTCLFRASFKLEIVPMRTSSHCRVFFPAKTSDVLLPLDERSSLRSESNLQIAAPRKPPLFSSPFQFLESFSFLAPSSFVFGRFFLSFRLFVSPFPLGRAKLF